MNFYRVWADKNAWDVAPYAVTDERKVGSFASQDAAFEAAFAHIARNIRNLKTGRIGSTDLLKKWSRESESAWVVAPGGVSSTYSLARHIVANKTYLKFFKT